MTVEMSQLSPRRPYLLRAFYEWLLDNQLTPHLVVDVTLPGVQVPMEYARDGQIVLNIAPRENGAGTMFEPEAAYDEEVASLNDDGTSDERESDTVMSVIDGDKPDHHDDNDPDDDPPPRGGRPALRVVK